MDPGAALRMSNRSGRIDWKSCRAESMFSSTALSLGSSSGVSSGSGGLEGGEGPVDPWRRIERSFLVFLICKIKY